MINDMVVLLGKEQVEDDTKKTYCENEFDKADDKKKELELSISDIEKAMDEAKESIETFEAEIKALEEGIIKLDREVAEATQQRKEEHADFEAQMANDGAVIQIIGVAKNRLNKFYNPKLYKPPPKRGLSEEERITVNMGGTLAPTNAPGGIAGTGIGLAQVSVHQADTEAPPPPPEADLAYKKRSAESTGVIAMMDSLIGDLEGEDTEMTVTEKDAQKDYEKCMADSAEKRAMDSKAITDKEASIAALEEE